MKNGEYESVEQMEADLNLMFENAKRYNMPNSSIYKRAFRLQQIMQVMLSELFTKILWAKRKASSQNKPWGIL